jgi:predicted RNase H-like nuclease
VREVHPEVSFAEMLGRPARASKKTWSGMRERLEPLQRAGIAVEGLSGTGAAGVDDVLDAAAAAWTAARILRGEAISLPATPEVDPATGRPIAIWA